MKDEAHAILPHHTPPPSPPVVRPFPQTHLFIPRLTPVETTTLLNSVQLSGLLHYVVHQQVAAAKGSDNPLAWKGSARRWRLLWARRRRTRWTGSSFLGS